MERIWSWAGRYPYRCFKCKTRFYAFNVPQKNDGDPHHGPEAPASAAGEKAYEQED